MITQNFGHYKGSLHNVLGTMTEATEKALKYDDITSQRVAARKHELKEGGKKNYRGKKGYKPKNKDGPSYESGCEPIPCTSSI